MYGPVTGADTPLAPPMRVTPADGGFVGRCDPGIAHEGPPGYGYWCECWTENLTAEAAHPPPRCTQRSTRTPLHRPTDGEQSLSGPSRQPWTPSLRRGMDLAK
ncbi:hypothetical protein SSP24_41750 [Streptomyces spinoverrucosus]|uniref:Uncharacterized protein n=1 Tax=Streptomyces spinoverrucosus TaxID=284043 RepID=A0A4Y3VL39_9ACTN|nr:hypothetical protein SSP24_41750 [Streptomyces spinoverrucosus]GHB54597.1 hypothetical protein GCM10010397_26100 [Streptomyces spinoverrucosus]